MYPRGNLPEQAFAQARFRDDDLLHVEHARQIRVREQCGADRFRLLVRNAILAHEIIHGNGDELFRE